MENQNQNQFQPQAQPAAPEPKPKKPWYKKWWIWVILGAVLTIAVGAFAIVQNQQMLDDIRTSIKNKDFSAAHSKLESYQKTNPTYSEGYILYADLYIAEKDPQKAVAILQEGMEKVKDDSDKNKLQNKIDVICEEYKIQPTTASDQAETTVSPSDKKAENTTAKPTEAPEASKEEFIKSCQTIDYKTLARNPDKYKGNNYKLTGKVIQVLDSDSWFDDSTTLRINITAEPNEFAEGGYLWDDTIVASVTISEGEDRILENDIIDFYGTCAGLYTYESVLGQKISLPRIDIKYFEIQNK